MARSGMQPLSCWPPSGRWLCRRRRPSPSPFSHSLLSPSPLGTALLRRILRAWRRRSNDDLASDRASLRQRDKHRPAIRLGWWDHRLDRRTRFTAGNERLSSRTFMRGEFADIALWLDEEARRLFPDSVYARNREGCLRPDLGLRNGERPSM